MLYGIVSKPHDLAKPLTGTDLFYVLPARTSGVKWGSHLAMFLVWA
jgi:hypothetical protein